MYNIYKYIYICIYMYIYYIYTYIIIIIIWCLIYHKIALCCEIHLSFVSSFTWKRPVAVIYSCLCYIAEFMTHPVVIEGQNVIALTLSRSRKG